MLLMALPADASDAQVTLANGVLVTPGLHDGVALVRFPRTAIAAGWTDAAGTRHITTLVQHQARRPDPQGCPRLDPLPPDAVARARRAALMAADYLYAGLEAASVTGVSRLGPVVCTHAVTDRTLNVGLRLVPTSARARHSSSLTQGRLLVGMVHGRMTVWMVQH
jgi:hypothetical protein